MRAEWEGGKEEGWLHYIENVMFLSNGWRLKLFCNNEAMKWMEWAIVLL